MNAVENVTMSNITKIVTTNNVVAKAKAKKNTTIRVRSWKKPRNTRKNLEILFDLYDQNFKIK